MSPSAEANIEINTAEARLMAETSLEIGKRLEKRFEDHAHEQKLKFTAAEDKQDRYHAQAAARHAAVEDALDNVPRCVQKTVEKSVAPIRKDVASLRGFFMKALFGLIVLLISALSYIIANGAPWAAMSHGHVS